jgi:hypothetical protein
MLEPRGWFTSKLDCELMRPQAQRSVLDFLQVMAVCIIVAGVFIVVGIYVGP